MEYRELLRTLDNDESVRTFMDGKLNERGEMAQVRYFRESQYSWNNAESFSSRKFRPRDPRTARIFIIWVLRIASRSGDLYPLCPALARFGRSCYVRNTVLVRVGPGFLKFFQSVWVRGSLFRPLIHETNKTSI